MLKGGITKSYLFIYLSKNSANVAVSTFVFLLTICLKRPNASSFLLKVVALARYLPFHFGSLLQNVARGLAQEERGEMTDSCC